MSLLSFEVDRALGELQTALEAQAEFDVAAPFITWKGTDYVCVTATSSKGKLFGAGGFTLDNDLNATLRTKLFTADLPQPDQFIVFKGEKYRIDFVKTTGDGASISLLCNSPDRGAGIVERER